MSGFQRLGIVEIVKMDIKGDLCTDGIVLYLDCHNGYRIYLFDDMT